MRLPGLAVALSLMVCGADAQDLAPEVLLLSRIKLHMRDELSHLTNYTCLQTTARFHKEAASPSNAHPKMGPMDTVLLEVVYSDHREWYGSPGDRNLSEEHPAAFIASGMIGNGIFAMALNNLFLSDLATFTYRGNEALGGRDAIRYDFHWSQLTGGFIISVAEGTGTVGQEGSFWVDPQSLDLIRLEARAIDFPPFLPLIESSFQVAYARMQIGSNNALLAQDGSVYMLKLSGEESYNHLDFTHCRAFSAQSAIQFGESPDPAKPAPANAAPNLSAPGSVTEAVPPFLQVTLELATPVTDKDSVGTLIQAKISGDVIRKNKIVVPDGSPVRGRIRRLERYQTGNEFIVGLEFSEVEVGGVSLRFYADLVRTDRTPGIRPVLSSERLVVGSSGGVQKMSETITLPDLPGVAQFFVQGKTLSLPKGFRMVWRTRGLIHQ
jgi:hypothetical protein